MPMPLMPMPQPFAAADEKAMAPRGPDASPPKPRPAPAPAMSAPMPPPMVVDKVVRKEEAADASAYLAKLAQLARDLATHARAGNTGALRVVRQRLTEWVEDLRSVGGHDTLADAVEHQVTKLTAALTGADPTSEALAIATELARLADGGAPPPKQSGRAAFWK